jgi:TolA-binding protein
MRNALCVIVLALLASPKLLPADKKDEALAEIQRDVAQVDEKVKDLQKTQAAQAKDIEALKSLVQQSASTSAQVSQDMLALQKALTLALNNAISDQQSKISQGVGPLTTRLGELATSVDQLNATLSAMNDRLAKVEKKLNDVSDTVRTINQPPPAIPVPASVAPADTSSGGGSSGYNKTSLQEDAQRDITGGNDELALKELRDYIKNWPMDAWAPTAGYQMGMVYKRTKDYDSATQAFQAVIDNYPGNNMAQDALFQKAMALELWPGHKADAIDTFKDFISKYPVNDNIPTAKRELAKLQSPSSASKGKGRGPGK